jgi:hypothetical protein
VKATEIVRVTFAARVAPRVLCVAKSPEAAIPVRLSGVCPGFDSTTVCAALIERTVFAAATAGAVPFECDRLRRSTGVVRNRQIAR